MEEVARRAGRQADALQVVAVQKALVLDMFEERIAVKLAVPDVKTAEQAIRAQVAEVIRLAGASSGKVAAEIIAEGQSDPTILEEYRNCYSEPAAGVHDGVDRAGPGERRVHAGRRPRCADRSDLRSDLLPAP